MEGNGVLEKSKQWICKFIVLFIFITGMCFEEVKADSVFVCTLNPSIDSYIQSSDADDIEVEHSTVEVIATRSSSNGRQIVHPMTTGKKGLRLSVALLYVVVLDLLLSNSYATSFVLAIPERMCKTSVVNYIHNTDGKKRV